MCNIIFFGPPGAGKGTQAKKISIKLDLPHLSTGDILRLKIKQNDSLAVELRKIMASGNLVSDKILNQIVSESLLDCTKGFILDGYPRTVDQLNFLNKFLKLKNFNLDFIFNIDIDFNILKERILKRSQEENRDDDNIDAIKVRYDAYLKTTKEVSDFYRIHNSNIFYEIDGSAQIEEITSKIKQILKKT